LVDSNSGNNICQIAPIDKLKNAEGSRKTIVPIDTNTNEENNNNNSDNEVAPLLMEILATHAQTGLPPAYIPKDE
jgi:hypothetical protein